MSSYNVRFEFPNGLYVDSKIDGNTKLTPHFKVYEMANTKGKISIPQLVLNEKVWNFYLCFEEFRNWYYKLYGTGINVNSNYRQVAFNKSVGGDSKSLHLRGLAIDFPICKAAKTDAQRKLCENQWKIITMPKGLIGGCNWYTNGFHFSVYENEQFGYTNFIHRDYRGKAGDW